jgi:hypothetical protein
MAESFVAGQRTLSGERQGTFNIVRLPARRHGQVSQRQVHSPIKEL